jgi:chaperonin GroEL (HSP60 family)
MGCHLHRAAHAGAFTSWQGRLPGRSAAGGDDAVLVDLAVNSGAGHVAGQLISSVDDLQVSGDYAIGAGIVRRAQSEPAHLIAANVGYPAAEIMTKTTAMGVVMGLTHRPGVMAT